MIEPELFDIVELLKAIPAQGLRVGMQGAIVECHDGQIFEVEFTDDDGETINLLPLQSSEFMVVWKARDNTWISVSEKLTSLLSALPSDRQQQVFEFAKSLYTSV